MGDGFRLLAARRIADDERPYPLIWFAESYQRGAMYRVLPLIW
jgi:hypothetical protein